MKKLAVVTVLLAALVFTGCESFVAMPLEATEFKEMVEDNPDVQLIDVRTAQEFSTGHLVNSRNIDFYRDDLDTALDELDREKPIAVYCAMGQRSQAVYDKLVEMKFHEVYHLTGGTQAWQAQGYDLTR